MTGQDAGLTRCLFMARLFHGVIWADGTPSAPEKDGKDGSNSSNSNTCSDCSYHQNSTYDTNDAEVHKNEVRSAVMTQESKVELP